jgi:pSer/pThr/pTyr-binding forkhead associated (FHA) protein
MKEHKVPQAGSATTPTSELRLRPALRYALRYRGQLFPIQSSVVTLGRNLDCDVVLSGSMVSRVHARILIEGDNVVIEDLLSRNGVAVDGVLIDRPRRIEPGARLRLGDEAVELLAERIDHSVRPTTGAHVAARLSAVPPAPAPSEHPTKRPATDELTNRADLFDLLGAAVERAFLAKNGEEVERLIGRHLERLIDQARSARAREDELFGRAALYAIRIGVVMHKPGWFDYVFRLYTTLGTPLPLPIVDQLSAHIRRIPGINRQLLRDYVARLRNVAGQMTADQRFRLQRVESLERLVSL